MRLPILVAADHAEWEARLVSAFEAHDSRVHVARRCVDIVELMSVAEAGRGRAALVSTNLRNLDANAVDRLHAARVRLVGVISDDNDAHRPRSIGIDELVRDDDDVEAIVSALVAIAQGDEVVDRAFADPLAAASSPPSPDASRIANPPRRGRVIAVWGPPGAPGRTTVAIGLATEIAHMASALLIDADVYGGVIANALGILDESPGLAAACRQAAATRLTSASLAELCWQISPGVRVLTGIAMAQRWTELRPVAVESVLVTARSMVDFIVVDCSGFVETDEELSFDSIAPRRNGATLTVLDSADLVLVVGACDPIGLKRLIRGLTELRDAEIATPRILVLNKVRSGSVAGDASAEAIEALDRFAGCRPSAMLPWDLEALDAAVLAGQSLDEARPNSPLRRAFVELARDVTGIESRSRRRNRRC